MANLECDGRAIAVNVAQAFRPEAFRFLVFKFAVALRCAQTPCHADVI
jgi:hypothetical protein